MFAKQSTAATLIIGPILDSTGAEYTSAVIGDISLSKNGATLTALAAAATLTHIANGQYTLVLTTGNTDTLGRAQFTCNKSTYQMPPVNMMILPANIYDSWVAGTANQKVDLDTIKTQTLTCSASVTVSPFVGSTGAAVNGTNVNTLSGHDPGATLGTSTLTQTQVTGGAYSVQSSSCVLGDARIANLDAAVSTRLAGSDYSVSAIAAACWDLADKIETGVTPAEALRANSAILAGIISGAGTSTEVFKGIGLASNGTTRVTVTADSIGNRSAVTLNL